MRTHFLGEHIGLWLLMIAMLAIIGAVYYVAWLSGGLFGECWSPLADTKAIQECLRNLNP